MRSNSIILSLFLFFALGAGLVLASSVGENRTPAGLEDREFDVSVKDTDLSVVLKLIAKQANMEIVVDESVTGKVSYSFSKVTLKEALERISDENRLDYFVKNRKVFVGKGSFTLGSESVEKIKIKYATAAEVAKQISAMIDDKEGKLVVDSRTNSILYFGPPRSAAKIKALIDFLDEMPEQILIEAKVVETSKNFLRDIGLSFGDITDLSLDNRSSLTGYVSNPGPSAANFALKSKIGGIDGRDLEIRLAAAETTGDAKVLSRPKVVTLNNEPASISSGISFYVKTLSTVAAGSGEVATGGVTTVNAGLQLSVTPTIVGTNRVRMAIDLNSSEPDLGTAVDGIPGVVTNAAATAVVVRNGQTATIAGLIKRNKGNSNNGVPFLKDIPVIGILFESHSLTQRDSELVIFITPNIIGEEGIAKHVSDEEEKKKESKKSTKKKVSTTSPSKPLKLTSSQ